MATGNLNCMMTTLSSNDDSILINSKVGLGRGLAYKTIDTNFFQKSAGRGRASVLLNEHSPKRPVIGARPRPLKSAETTNVTSCFEPPIRIPKEFLLLIQLSERVLTTLQTVKRPMSVSELAKELYTDENQVNTVVFMLYTHHKVLYIEGTNSWSLITIDHGENGLHKLLKKTNESLRLSSKDSSESEHSSERKIQWNSETIISNVQNTPECEEQGNHLNVREINEAFSSNVSEYVPPSLSSVSTNDSTVCQISPTQSKPIVSVEPFDTKTVAIAHVASLSGEDLTSLQKSPLSALHEYGQKNKVVTKVDIVEQNGGPHNPSFQATASVNGEVLGTAWAATKKEAKRDAAHRALTVIVSLQQAKGKRVELRTLKALNSIFNNEKT